MAQGTHTHRQAERDREDDLKVGCAKKVINETLVARYSLSKFAKKGTIIALISHTLMSLQVLPPPPFLSYLYYVVTSSLLCPLFLSRLLFSLCACYSTCLFSLFSVICCHFLSLSLSLSLSLPSFLSLSFFAIFLSISFSSIIQSPVSISPIPLSPTFLFSLSCVYSLSL